VGNSAGYNKLHSRVRVTKSTDLLLGRAIGALGIGIDASIATLDEIQHAKERGKVMRTTEALPDDPWITEAPAPQYDGAVPGKGSSMYPLTGPQLKAIHAILAKRDIRDDLDKLANVNACYRAQQTA